MISSLPPELLAVVLRRAWTPFDGLWQRPTALMRLKLVCKAWRDLIEHEERYGDVCFVATLEDAQHLLERVEAKTPPTTLLVMAKPVVDQKRSLHLVDSYTIRVWNLLVTALRQRCTLRLGLPSPSLIPISPRIRYFAHRYRFTQYGLDQDPSGYETSAMRAVRVLQIRVAPKLMFTSVSKWNQFQSAVGYIRDLRGVSMSNPGVGIGHPTQHATAAALHTLTANQATIEHVHYDHIYHVPDLSSCRAPHLRTLYLDPRLESALGLTVAREHLLTFARASVGLDGYFDGLGTYEVNLTDYSYLPSAPFAQRAVFAGPTCRYIERYLGSLPSAEFTRQTTIVWRRQAHHRQRDFIFDPSDADWCRDVDAPFATLEVEHGACRRDQLAPAGHTLLDPRFDQQREERPRHLRRLTKSILATFGPGIEDVHRPGFRTLRVACRWGCREETASRWEALEEACEARGLRLERVYGKDIGWARV